MVVYSFSWESPSPSCISSRLHGNLGLPLGFLLPASVHLMSCAPVLTRWSPGVLIVVFLGWILSVPAADLPPRRYTLALAFQRAFHLLLRTGVFSDSLWPPVCSILFFLPLLWHITCLVFIAFANIAPFVLFLWAVSTFLARSSAHESPLCTAVSPEPRRVPGPY